MDLREMWSAAVYWFELAQHRIQRQNLVNALMNPWIAQEAGNS
jgi:hypothetical protein